MTASPRRKVIGLLALGLALAACNLPGLTPAAQNPTESPIPAETGDTLAPAATIGISETPLPTDQASAGETQPPSAQPSATVAGNPPAPTAPPPSVPSPTSPPTSVPPTRTHTPAPPTLTSTPLPPTATGTSVPPTATTSGGSFTDIISYDNTVEMQNLINQARCGQGLTPLTINALLGNAAYVHDLDMVTNNFFDHRGSDGSTVGDRVSRQGYTWIAVGENLAAGPPGTAETFGMWWNSPDHKANMLNADFREMGLSHLFRAGTTYGHYWTLVLGSQGTTPPTCAEMGY